MSGTFPDLRPEAHRPGDELVDYLLGDLPPEEAAQLERRLAEDSLLRVELYELRRMMDAMRALPSVGAGPEFVASVMAARDRNDEAPVPRRSRRMRVRALLAMTAALAIVATGVLISRTANEPMPVFAAQATVTPEPTLPVVAAESVVDYKATHTAAFEALRNTQLPNGAWDSETGGGTWKARPGLTALVLCGLIQASSGECFTGPDAAVATRALDYLISTVKGTDLQQRALVVHRQQLVFVGVALSEARQICRDPETERRIDQALAALNISAGPERPRIASAILPHLPEEAARQGGRIYQLARTLLLETTS